MCHHWNMAGILFFLCDVELPISFPSCIWASRVQTWVFHKWNMCSLLNITLCLDHMHTARIYLGVLFCMLPFPINQQYVVISVIFTKQVALKTYTLVALLFSLMKNGMNFNSIYCSHQETQINWLSHEAGLSCRST